MRLPVHIGLIVLGAALVSAQPAVQLASVRLDDTFQVVGSNTSGLVVSITLNDLQSRRTSDDFALVLFDANGRRSGTLACIAIRSLDGAGSKPPWILLDGATGALARTYRPLVDSKVAVVEPARKEAMTMAGRYELVYLVGANQRRAALAYGDDVAHRPSDVERRLIDSFAVPWP